MAYVLYIGDRKDGPTPKRREGFLAALRAEWREASPGRRAIAGALLALILAAGIGIGGQAVAALSTVLFPIAARDLPPDADPGPVASREDIGVYDRRVPGGVAIAGAGTQAPAEFDDPSEHPFVRGAPPPPRGRPGTGWTTMDAVIGTIRMRTDCELYRWRRLMADPLNPSHSQAELAHPQAAEPGVGSNTPASDARVLAGRWAEFVGTLTAEEAAEMEAHIEAAFENVNDEPPPTW